MATDLSREPEFQSLVEALIEKTRAGKVDWEETAEEGCFIAAVKGKNTFEIKRFMLPPNERERALISNPLLTAFHGKVAPRVGYLLSVRDENGHLLFDVQQEGPESSLQALYQAAQRIASRVDERIDNALELLNSL